MTPKIAIISEGITDRWIIERILAAYLNDKKLKLKALQPESPTDTRMGWSAVLKACEEKIQQAFMTNDYLIIQIDTDLSSQWSSRNLSTEQPVHVAHTDPDTHREKTVSVIVYEVREVLEKLLHLPPEDDRRNRILFAICVHSTECWLLPFIADTDEFRAKSATCFNALKNYVNRLNIKSSRNNKTLYLSENSNKGKLYPAILDHIWKQMKKAPRDLFHSNPSLEMFIQTIDNTLKSGQPRP